MIMNLKRRLELLQNYVKPRKPDYDIIWFYKNLKEQNKKIDDDTELKEYLRYIQEKPERKQEYANELKIICELLEV